MFLVCGEALFDLFVLADGEDEDGAVPLRAVAGGSPYNVAIGLARLGHRVALSTQLFDDALGGRLEETLRHEGVDLSFVRRGGGATPLALVDVDGEGAPRYAFHGLRGMCVHPDVPEGLRASLTGIHVGSVPIVSACSSEKLLELIIDAGGPLISFDPNVRLAVEPDTSLWRAQVERFRRHAHLIKVSTEDLEAIHGSHCDPGRIALGWLEQETAIVVLTRGSQGCVLFSAQHEPIELPAAPTRVADTTGAGDSFMAALLCWLDEGGYARAGALPALNAEQLRSMADFASHAAAKTCSRQGPAMPRRAELAGPAFPAPAS